MSVSFLNMHHETNHIVISQENASMCWKKWKPCEAAFNSTKTPWGTVIINPCFSLHRESVVWPDPQEIEETLAEEWVMEALMLVTVHFSTVILHAFIHSCMTVHDDMVQILKCVLCCCVGSQRNQGPGRRQGRHGHQRWPCECTYCWSETTWWEHAYNVYLRLYETSGYSCLVYLNWLLGG